MLGGMGMGMGDKTVRELFVGNTPQGTSDFVLLEFLNAAMKQVSCRGPLAPWVVFWRGVCCVLARHTGGGHLQVVVVVKGFGVVRVVAWCVLGRSFVRPFPVRTTVPRKFVPN